MKKWLIKTVRVAIEKLPYLPLTSKKADPDVTNYPKMLCQLCIANKMADEMSVAPRIAKEIIYPGQGDVPHYENGSKVNIFVKIVLLLLSSSFGCIP